MSQPTQRAHDRGEESVGAARARDQLIALEIRARCEEWACSEIEHPQQARALRELQHELRCGIWSLGVQASVDAEAAPGLLDPWLLSELRATSQLLRRYQGSHPRIARILTSIDETTRILEAYDRDDAEGFTGVYRTPAAGIRDAPRVPRTAGATDHQPADDGAARARRRTDIARGVAFVALAWGGMAAAAAGLRWMPVAMAVLLLAWLAGLPGRGL